MADDTWVVYVAVLWVLDMFICNNQYFRIKWHYACCMDMSFCFRNQITKLHYKYTQLISDGKSNYIVRVTQESFHN